MTSKKQKANVLYVQLLAIEDGFNQREKENGVIFHTELSEYNALLENSSNDLGGDICKYAVSDNYLTTSAKGNKFVYPSGILFQVKCLLKYLEVKYKISAPETSFINDQFLKDKYSLYVRDRKRYTASDTLLSVTLEFEDRLRRMAELPSESTGIDLANRALHPRTGALTLVGMSSKDAEGYYNIVKGLFDFVRGGHHHIKNEIGRQPLFQKIIFIDMALGQFSNLIRKEIYEQQNTTPN